MRTGALSAFLGLALAAGAALAAGPEVKARVAAPDIRQDETTRYLLEIEWPAREGDYSFAVPEIPLTKLEVLRRGEAQETFLSGGAEWRKKTFEFELKPTEAGTAAVGAYDLPYFVAAQPAGTFHVSEVRVKVRKAPNVPARRTAGGSLLVSFCGFVVWKILSARLRKRQAAAEPPDPAREPAERIRSLAGQGASEKQSLYALSTAFREWLSAYYGLEGRQDPETRWIEKLKEKDLPREEWLSLSEMLSSLHEAKYAPQAQAPALMRRVREFVDARTPAG